MEERIFRDKSLKRIESPEELNDYISVTSPAIWMLFAGVVLILVGVLVWAAFGTIYSQIVVPAHVEDGIATGYIEADELNEICPGMEVIIEDTSGVIEDIADSAVVASDVLSAFMLEEVDFAAEARVYAITFPVNLPDGGYIAFIVTEKISPISFLTN